MMFWKLKLQALSPEGGEISGPCGNKGETWLTEKRLLPLMKRKKANYISVQFLINTKRMQCNMYVCLMKCAVTEGLEFHY